MDRRRFIRNTSLSALALSLYQTGSSASIIKDSSRKKITVGAHVWVYASTMPGYDVSPILSQIFSDMAYAGFDGIETMEQPLRSTVYTKQIKELIDQYKIKLNGSSYGAEMWNKDKQNEIYEDVDLIFTNMASVGARTFGVSVGEPACRKKTEDEFDNQADLLKRLIALGHKKGNVNFKEIGDVLREINFEGVANIELAHENGFVRTRPLKESLKMSREYMRKTMGM